MGKEKDVNDVPEAAEAIEEDGKVPDNQKRVKNSKRKSKSKSKRKTKKRKKNDLANKSIEEASMDRTGAEEKDEDEEEQEGEEETEEAEEKSDGGDAEECEVDVEETEEAEVEEGDIGSCGEGIQMEMDQDSSDEEEEGSRAMQPQNMHFQTTDYTTSVRIASRCKVSEAVEFLEQFPEELEWLKKNEQFKHIFHLPDEPNHQVQALWMLILRSCATEVERQCWFLVNGKLIRYSIREHAILTGLNCKNYPPNWQTLGSLGFAKRVLVKTKGITVSKLEEVLLSMKNPSGDRMKLAVLYFLAKVFKAKNKYDPGVDQFLMRIVDDLSICGKFPWGRYTYNDCVDSIKGVVDSMKRGLKKSAQPGFNGFIIPPEILAFECIPKLGRKFRVDIKADRRCPRMCKRKFVKVDSKGFTLEELYKELGDETEIISILQPTKEEVALLRKNVEDDVDDGLGFIDPVVESWRECLVVQKKDIFWKDWHKKEVDARAGTASKSEMSEAVGVVEKEKIDPLQEVLLKAMDEGFAMLKGALQELDKKVVDKLSDLENRVQNLHHVVGRWGPNVMCSGVDVNNLHKGFVMISDPIFPPTVGDGDKLETGVEQRGEDVDKQVEKDGKHVDEQVEQDGEDVDKQVEKDGKDVEKQVEKDGKDVDEQVAQDRDDGKETTEKVEEQVEQDGKETTEKVEKQVEQDGEDVEEELEKVADGENVQTENGEEEEELDEEGADDDELTEAEGEEVDEEKDRQMYIAFVRSLDDDDNEQGKEEEKHDGNEKKRTWRKEEDLVLRSGSKRVSKPPNKYTPGDRKSRKFA